MTSGRRASTCSSSSTRSSTSPRSRPGAWSSSQAWCRCRPAPPTSSSVWERAARTRSSWSLSWPTTWASVRGRAAAQAGGAQPGVERREVHPGRRAGRRTSRARRRRRRGPGDRHRCRCPDRGPRAHLRVVPAGSPRHAAGGRDRPRPDPLPSHRGSLRRNPVARAAGRRRRQHLRVPCAAAARGVAAPGRDGRGAHRPTRRRRPGLPRPDDGVPLGDPVQILRAHDGLEALALARTAGPVAIALDIRLPAWTAGRC